MNQPDSVSIVQAVLKCYACSSACCWLELFVVLGRQLCSLLSWPSRGLQVEPTSACFVLLSEVVFCQMTKYVCSNIAFMCSASVLS